jgi:hypothetical protein
VNIPAIAAGDEVVVASRPWRPAVGEHTCLRVIVESKNGEVTFDNNEAQENVFAFDTAASSPYAPIEFDVHVRTPYTIPVSVDLRARGIPEGWFVALDKATLLLRPGEVRPVHVLIWTDRAAEWEQGNEKRSPRVAAIKIEAWADVLWDYWYPIGGAEAICHAVRRVDIKPGRVFFDNRFFISGSVAPPVGQAVPMAVHVLDPQGETHTERFTTSPAGQFAYSLTTSPEKSGVYEFQLFVLGGSLAGEAESEKFTIVVP